MIDRQYGKIVYECDACPVTLETDESDWDDAKREFDRMEWRAEKVGKDWVHTCRGCSR